MTVNTAVAASDAIAGINNAILKRILDHIMSKFLRSLTLSAEVLEAWYGLFKIGDSAYFATLQNLTT
ncbi:hypothetical protein HJG54_25365 [Leptolyngbya sp. NK1-12]|uniref:Uncharacterized protein n=1 Tax=Leptolyngbya sp. NK1-12 TaxID=2547451 RepID=A0AA96WNI8_9CYAN|nr:hypothetical protein [Leptolyngbya sp. NK1-12]WNZ25836.1 hypothetical protein HJG54_25365 [Leptolyngbya sp. NK1-12]